VGYQKLGMTIEEILEDLPNLTTRVCQVGFRNKEQLGMRCLNDELW